LGGAIADSGGAISIVAIILFAVLAKLSLDMLIRLSVEVEGAHGSYEQLGQVGFGAAGKLMVVGSKFLYSFGCLIAYIIVVKDNFGPAARSLIYGNSAPEGHSWLYHLLGDDFWMTWILSASVILPLCLLRDMTPLASLSVVSVVSMVGIVGIVIYLFAFNPNGEIRHPSGGVYEDWFEIRPAFLEWYVWAPQLMSILPIILLQTTRLTHILFLAWERLSLRLSRSIQFTSPLVPSNPSFVL
jgi:amino acid permease